MSIERLEAAVAAIAACGSRPELVDALLAAVTALGASDCSLGVLEGTALRQLSRGRADEAADGETTLSLDDPLPGAAAVRTTAPQVFSDRASVLDRFPAAAAGLCAVGEGAAVWLPLVKGEAPLGYVAVHYRGENRPDPAELLLLRTLAATCAGTLWRLALDAERIRELTSKVDGLHTAMATRATIEQAKGVLMHRFTLSPVGAWDLLRRLSSTSNLKIRVLAERIVAGEPVQGIAEPANGQPAAGRAGLEPPGPAS